MPTFDQTDISADSTSYTFDGGSALPSGALVVGPQVVAHLLASCYFTGPDGRYYPRYPNGNVPSPLAGIGRASSGAFGNLKAGASLRGPAIGRSLGFGALTTAVGVSSAALQFSFPSGFASAGSVLQRNASAAIGTALALTPSNASHTAGSVWHKTRQDISRGFVANFTLQCVTSGLAVPSIAGLTFCVQNANGAPYGGISVNASADANCCGYGDYDPATHSGQAPINNSIAVKFDLSNANSQNNYVGQPSTTGLYINGGPFESLNPANDMAAYGINLYTTHVFAVTIVYDGSVITWVIRDTTTGAQYRQSAPINIPLCVGGNLAYVGFTGGTGPGTLAGLNINSWDFSTGFNARLSSPTFSVSPGRYSSAQSVSLSGPAGATLYYTLDGKMPTSASTAYAGTPIAISASQAIQAVAIKAGQTDSFVAIGNYQIAAPGTPLINFPSGFAAANGLITLAGRAVLSGSAIRLTDTNSAGQESGAAWYSVPVGVATFSANFTLKFTSAVANGLCFVIQNPPPASADGSIYVVSGGPNAIAGSQSGLGYGNANSGSPPQYSGLQSSVAIKFDVWNGNTTGLFTNGAQPTTPQTTITGVTLSGGHPINVALTYDGTTLSMTLTDTVTGGTFSKSWTVNIPAAVGGSTGYVGFTASTGGQFAFQDIQAWTYATP